jgi:membrane associated rhomboid family serine protease
MDPQFKPYQIITHMFAHGGFAHILSTCLGFGCLERSLRPSGDRKISIFLFGLGIGAAFCHMAVQYFRYTQIVELANSGQVERAQALYQALGPALGASGAIMGIFVAFAYLFPNTELIIIFFPIPMKAKWVVLILIGLDLFGGFGYIHDNVAHWAHLGGALVGFLLVFYWNRTNRRKFY